MGDLLLVTFKCHLHLIPLRDFVAFFCLRFFFFHFETCFKMDLKMLVEVLDTNFVFVILFHDFYRGRHINSLLN